VLLCHATEILDPFKKKKKKKKQKKPPPFKSQLLVFSFDTSNEGELEEEFTPLFILQQYSLLH